MEKIREQIKTYKWVLIVGVIVALLMAILAANMHVISFISYRMQGDTKDIIRLLNRDIKNKSRQDDWYFTQGTQYLLEEASSDGLAFLEENFDKFNVERQYHILEGYNNKKLLFVNHNSVIKLLMQHLDHLALQNYVKRLDSEVLDEELFYYFGDNPDVTNDFVSTLYKILAAYPNQLPLNQFKFNLYTLLTMDGEEIDVKRNLIFSKLHSQAAKELLFKELKTKPIKIEALNEWIELLSKNKVVNSDDYAAFTAIYSELQLIRSRHKSLGEREVDFLNKKQTIEMKIGDSLKLLETNLTNINGVKYEVASLEKELNELTDYAYMALYIDKAYGGGDYEASVPRKSLFGSYKPSSQKYIIKLNTTDFYKEGVYYVDVYLKGTKINDRGDEYPYYIEVSKENLERIDTLGRSRKLQLEELEKLTKETAVLQQQVDYTKQEMGYDQNEAELKNIASERQGLLKKMESKIIEIKNLFGIGNIDTNAFNDLY
ncbi:MAG: hypothetical protein K0S71_75 [Clostridia bacterium]|jgi:hypothetical protein|nr:hypothetical protein [Clostridia bacterium]